MLLFFFYFSFLNIFSFNFIFIRAKSAHNCEFAANPSLRECFVPLTSLLATLVSLFVLLNTRFARYVWPTAIAGLCPEAPARATPLAWCYAPCCMVATLPSLLRRLVRSLRSLTNLGRGYAPPKGYALSVPSALLIEWGLRPRKGYALCRALA